MVVTRIAARICMMALFVTAFAADPALAQADDANKILKAMTDYYGGYPYGYPYYGPYP